MPGTPPYVELHAHSAYSLLDGASTPDELIERAGELGHTAFAITDHDSLAGAMELAMAARDSTAGGHPVRAIFGAEVTIETPAGGESDEQRHVTLLVRDGRGWSNLCRLLTRAHAHYARHAGSPRRPALRLAGRGVGALRRAGLSDRLSRARHRRRGDRATAAGRVRARLAAGRAAAPLRRRGHAMQSRTRAPRAEPRMCRPSRPETCTRIRPSERTCRTRSPRSVTARPSTRARLQLRPNDTHVLATPAGMAARFADFPDAVAESVRLAETLTFDLTGDLGYRYPGPKIDDATRGWRRSATPSSRGATRPATAVAARPPRACEQELALIDTLGLSGFFVLHFEILELARQVAFEVRGTDSAQGAAATRPRPWFVGVLDRVLPRGALAHRPDRERPRDRPVPARGHHGAAGHRHRLPPRHSRAR